LSGVLTNTLHGLRLTGIEYVRPTRAGDALPGTAEHDVLHTAYAWDHTGTVFRAGNWSYWTLDHAPSYLERGVALSPTGLAGRVLQPDSWDAWSFDAGEVTVPPGWPASALHYPYASEVVSYDPGPGVDWPDPVSGESYTNPLVALGRPTVDTTEEGIPPPEDLVPVVPVYPPFRAFELVRLESNGHLTVSFDHRVLDSAANPYGLDLLLFGNSVQATGGGQFWEHGDPSNSLVSGTCSDEDGEISVSQDGAVWHTFTNGPSADGFMPTLGRVYDPANVDTNLGPGNRWWGFPTDPTVPPDPAVLPSDWSGMDVAEIARRYRGSAGGTGVDISGFDLPLDPNTARKWIRYVRITRTAAFNPEIDAVVDVSPGSPHTLWIADHFPWMGEPLRSRDMGDPDTDGTPNLAEYALGRDPTNSLSEPAFTVSLCATGTPKALHVHYTRGVDTRDVDVEIVRTDDLLAPAWTTNGVREAHIVSPPTHGVQQVTTRVPADRAGSFLRMRIDHDR
jgi:hypothetical protein